MFAVVVNIGLIGVCLTKNHTTQYSSIITRLPIVVCVFGADFANLRGFLLLYFLYLHVTRWYWWMASLPFVVWYEPWNGTSWMSIGWLRRGMPSQHARVRGKSRVRLWRVFDIIWRFLMQLINVCIQIKNTCAIFKMKTAALCILNFLL